MLGIFRTNLDFGLIIVFVCLKSSVKVLKVVVVVLVEMHQRLNVSLNLEFHIWGTRIYLFSIQSAEYMKWSS